MGIGSYLGAPLVTDDGKVFGSLVVLKTHANSFSQEDEGYIKLFSHILSTLIHHEYNRIHESITDQYNLSFFKELCQRENIQSGGVFSLDIDRFRYINDRYGYSAGNSLLKQVADRINSSLQGEYFLLKGNGDEFVLFSPGVENGEHIKEITTKLLSLFKQPFRIKEYDVYMTTSIGVSLFTSENVQVDLVFKQSELAMYAAKANVGNQYQLYTTILDKESIRKQTILNDLLSPHVKKEFYLLYQPQFCLNSMELIGVEALVRWKHPDLGMISPGEFIPLAEETGKIIELGDWVLNHACQEFKQYLINHQIQTEVKLSVNTSVLEFQQPDFEERVFSALTLSGLSPHQLELEITENIAMEAGSHIYNKMALLKQQGIQIAIDDFGTGYSSLGYLKEYPITTLKLDRSLIQEVDQDPKQNEIVKGITNIAIALQLQVVCEGIETEDQLQTLRELGPIIGQGYLLGKPGTLDQLFDSSLTLAKLADTNLI
nr:GGDEF domain-containing phosphodiesterase [Bacillus mesophilus]